MGNSVTSVPGCQMLPELRTNTKSKKTEKKTVALSRNITFTCSYAVLTVINSLVTRC